MSQENVEIMRRSFEAWARGDVAGVVEAIDDNAVTRPIIGPNGGVLTGSSKWPLTG